MPHLRIGRASPGLSILFLVMTVLALGPAAAPALGAPPRRHTRARLRRTCRMPVQRAAPLTPQQLQDRRLRPRHRSPAMSTQPARLHRSDHRLLRHTDRPGRAPVHQRPRPHLRRNPRPDLLDTPAPVTRAGGTPAKSRPDSSGEAEGLRWHSGSMAAGATGRLRSGSCAEQGGYERHLDRSPVLSCPVGRASEGVRRPEVTHVVSDIERLLDPFPSPQSPIHGAGPGRRATHASPPGSGGLGSRYPRNSRWVTAAPRCTFIRVLGGVGTSRIRATASARARGSCSRPSGLPSATARGCRRRPTTHERTDYLHVPFSVPASARGTSRACATSSAATPVLHPDLVPAPGDSGAASRHAHDYLKLRGGKARPAGPSGPWQAARRARPGP